tara:strand:- start:19176 stop:19871 length:696 start_codon:yes stop_codon:yes gene_type:complete
MNKTILVRDLFDDLSAKYDLLNDVFSFGFHRIWKKQLLTYLNPLSGEKWVDLCCGTGDLSISLAKSVGANGEIYGIDSAPKTLSLAKQRSLERKVLSIEWVDRDIFDDQNKLEYFDGAVMAYGLRNLHDPFEGLKRIRSFLKSGGRAGVLDFNRNPDNSIADLFQKYYLTKLVIPLASNIGFKEHFNYLIESINNFPDAKSQEKLALEAGFNNAKYYPIALKQMGILILKN